MLAAFQYHSSAAQKHLRRILAGFLTGNTPQHGSVTKSVQEHIGISRAAAGQGSGRIHQIFGDLIHKAAGIHKHPESFYVLGGYAAIGAEQRQPCSQGTGRVGQNT